jgi:hypothetical protein
MPPPKRAAKAGPKSIKEKRAKKEPESYEVQHILGVQFNKQTKNIEYLVKWQGWALNKSSWEVEDNVTSDDLTDSYNLAYQFLKSRFITKDNGYPSDTDSETEEERSARKLKGHWAVEAVLGVQLDTKKNQLQYLVKWEDWDDSYNSWEPLEHVSNCPLKIKYFKESMKELEKRREDLAEELPRPAVVSEDEEADENEPDNSKPQKKKATPKKSKGKKRAGPASKTLNGSGDATTPKKKRAGPKSRTATPVTSSKKRAGPRSRTVAAEVSDAEDAAPSPPKKRAGPKSRTKK